MDRIILFDGVCNFCDSSVQFIINRDPKGHYKFASLQSDTGQKLLKKFGIKENTDSFILIENGKYFEKSTAALQICRNLKGVWKLFVIFKLLPTPIRDFFYELFATNRYKWFGKKETCILPSPDVRKRFLE